MDKSNKSQILKLSLIAALFFITPLLSTSLRPTYLYFIINLLIIALGAEAGLLKPSSEDKKAVINASKAMINASEASPDKKPALVLGPKAVINASEASPEFSEKKGKVVEKCASEKIVGAVKMMNKVKKCPSTPSLFFIGGGETEFVEEFAKVDYKEEEEEGEDISGQELFTRAETFIGNFYKQLKMQREESWKKIHGFYHKAF